MAKKKQKLRRVTRFTHVRNAIVTILLICAAALLFYPIVVNYFAGQQNVSSIQAYNQSVSKIGGNKAKKMLVEAQHYNAELYNKYIYDSSQRIPWKGQIPDYNKILRVNNSGMMGYISIPQIDVKNIPIYHGDSEKVLSEGVGHIPQTSLPIGGINTHAVLPAHSGRVNETLFTDLDKLKNGDVFYLHVLGKTLKYEVIREKIVVPADVRSLNIEPGKDLVTLVTCWPTGINNKRLLVTGQRIALDKKTPYENVQRNQFGYNFWVMSGAGLLALAGLLVLLRWLLAGRKLYSVSTKAENATALDEVEQAGDFGSGMYLTNHKKLAKVWAEREFSDEDEVFINVYRLKKAKKLPRWVFKSKSSNWQAYLDKAKAHDFVDTEHELVTGPVANQAYHLGKRITQFCLKSDEALEHLKYLRTIQLKK